MKISHTFFDFPTLHDNFFSNFSSSVSMKWDSNVTSFVVELICCQISLITVQDLLWNLPNFNYDHKWNVMKF